MPPLRSFRQKSRSSSKRRKFSDAVQREVKRLLPTIIQTVNQHNMQNHTPPPPPMTPHSPSPPPFHSPLMFSPRNEEVDYMTNNKSVDLYTWLARFQKQKPRSFSSATTPVNAQNWITHIEKIFEVMGVGDEFKARLATYKLEDDAQGWWGTVKHARGGELFVATLSWNDFKALFYRQYFSSACRGEYEREYASLKQRDDEPWSEFMTRFCRLASFLGPAAGEPLVQANKLKWAVCEKLKWLIVNQEFKDIAEVSNAVQNLEIASKYMTLQYDEIFKKNQTLSFENHKAYSNQTNSTQNRSLQQSRQNPNISHHSDSSTQKMMPQNQTKPLCSTCGKRHHGVCFRATGKCFRCGEADHTIKDCPKPNGNVVGNASRSASVVPPTTGGRVFALNVGNAPTEAELAKKRLKHHELLG